MKHRYRMTKDEYELLRRYSACGEEYLPRYEWSLKVWKRILIGFILFCMVMLVCIFIGASRVHAAELDYGRTCLALVGYSEARSEGLTGMLMVEQVVINRLLTRKFGDSICDVALSFKQFQGVSNWIPPRVPHENEAWDQAMAAAELIIGGADVMPNGCADVLYFSERPSRNTRCRLGKLYFSDVP